jgi:hypothetical protein
MTVRLALAVVSALALWPSAARAHDGNYLWANCDSREDAKQLYCLAYITGVSDAVRIAGSFCPPDNATYGQSKDVVIKYLRDHPEERHYAAAFLVGYALGSVFPCKPKQ